MEWDNDFEKLQWKVKAVLKVNRVQRMIYETDLLPANTSEIEKEKMKEWAFIVRRFAMWRMYLWN